MDFLQKYWKQIIALTISLIIVLVVSYSIAGFTFAKFTEALVAWGTIGLAIVAFWTIKKTIEENKVARKENREKEQRDRQIELIDEIVRMQADLELITMDMREAIVEFDNSAINLARRNFKHLSAKIVFFILTAKKILGIDLSDALTKFVDCCRIVTYCEAIKFSLKNPELIPLSTLSDKYGEDFKKLSEELTEVFIKNETEFDNLFETYLKAQRDAKGELINKCANIKTSLLKS